MAAIIIRYDRDRIDPLALAEGVRTLALVPVPDELVEDLGTEEAAEAIFKATNAPEEVIEADALAAHVARWFSGRPGTYPVLAVGDVVDLRRVGQPRRSVRVDPVGFSPA